jgi:hypothetical protein
MSTFAGEFMVLTSTPERTTGNNAVAVFNDLNLGDTTSSFTASIDWGDGSPPTAGTVTGGPGLFTVSGSHAYADEGSPPVSVTLTRTADQDTATASGNVTVTENDFLNGFGTTITRNLNQAFSGAVAFFTDGGPANVAGDFTASIDWGDGQTTKLRRSLLVGIAFERERRNPIIFLEIDFLAMDRPQQASCRRAPRIPKPDPVY